MNNIETIAKDYAIKLGIAPCMSGFYRFTEAVITYVNAPEPPSLGSVCRSIAEKFATNAHAVQRDIAYAIKSAQNIRERLSNLTGIPISHDDIRPKYVICLVAECIKRELP